MFKKQKIIIIVGPTASGKSACAVRMAKKYNGEIISADSRQVYRGLDIGTGKITKQEMRGVRHHGLDLANPKHQFSAAEFAKQASRAIEEICKRKKIPIIAGGTGFWIDALVSGLALPDVPPNLRLRRKLEKKEPQELYRMIRKLDPSRARNIDAKNPRRLIRAIEIADALGKVPRMHKQKKYDALWLGMRLPDKKLKQRIHTRLQRRMRQGMVAEARRARKHGLSWKRFYELGLEYRILADYLRKKIDKKTLFQNIERENNHYAKRQMRWWKRNKSINWIKNKKEAERLVRKFLL